MKKIVIIIKKFNPIEIPKIITMMILIMSTCMTASAQSPYAIFGGNSKMLEAKSETVNSIYRIGIQLTYGTNFSADFDMNKGLATLYDAEGNVLRQDSISENTKAMFTTMDPHAENYYNLSPYCYCGGNPVNAIDPDGELIIFINGNHFGDGGTSAYWRGVDNQIMNTTLDFHAFYYDGAMGGNFNRASMSCSNRIQSGYNKGYSEASRIISATSNESLKFITHSMGGAFGNGFVKGLQQWAQDNEKVIPQIEYVIDIAPFQGGSIEVSPDMRPKTIELSHIDDYIAGGMEEGIINENFHQSSSGNWLNPTNFFGHGISTFQTDIMQYLPESSIPSFNDNRWEENKSSK